MIEAGRPDPGSRTSGVGAALVLQRVLARMEPCRRRAGGSAPSTNWCAVAGLRRDEVTVLAEIGALNSFGHRSPVRAVAGRTRRAPVGRAVRADRGARGRIVNRRIAVHQSAVPQSPPIANRQCASIGNRQSTIDDEPAASDGRRRAPRRRLRRQRAHHRPASDDLPAPRALDARRAAGHRPAARARRAGACARPAWSSPASGRARPRASCSSRSRTKPASPTSSSGPICTPPTRLVVVESPFLLVEGVLQNQDGVTSVRAERLQRFDGLSDGASVESHDFH